MNQKYTNFRDTYSPTYGYPGVFNPATPVVILQAAIIKGLID